LRAPASRRSQVHGSAGLIQTLLQHDLIDELRLA
jgi:dihydrofolate reductase